MSIYDYRAGVALAIEDHPFDALIMAAMRQAAGTANEDKLKYAFPEIWEELEARYWQPGGVLPGEIP